MRSPTRSTSSSNCSDVSPVVAWPGNGPSGDEGYWRGLQIIPLGSLPYGLRHARTLNSSKLFRISLQASGRHCCIEVKSVLVVREAGRQDLSARIHRFD